ncbi:hypothetical protein K438DRAFT_1769568 [Mycena galopus ATCC 62051]|nr:hypothetical protein K438DRAFT_1769568 [Mycena galopus ATCC 62051]
MALCIYGFDVTDIDLIVEFGVPKTVIDDDQRAGRGGRDGRECLVLMIAERWAYDALAQSNPEHKPSNKEKCTEPAVISNASSRKDCRCRGLAKHNNDTTPDDNFDFNQYLLGTILTEAHNSDADLPAKQPRRKYRPVPQRDPVIHSLEAWRASIHAGDPVAQNFPISYILDDTAIEHLAREVSGFFRLPSNVTEFLGETTEWHSRHALDVVTIIRQHDLSAPQRRRNVNSASISDSEASDSEYSENSGGSSESDSDDDEIPTPTKADQTIMISISSHSSPSSSRSNSPTPSPSAPPPISSTGRLLRLSAANHRVAGTAEQMVSKKAKR